MYVIGKWEEHQKLKELIYRWKHKFSHIIFSSLWNMSSCVVFIWLYLYYNLIVYYNIYYIFTSVVDLNFLICEIFNLAWLDCHLTTPKGRVENVKHKRGSRHYKSRVRHQHQEVLHKLCLHLFVYISAETCTEIRMLFINKVLDDV